ncbi:hypothetical protein HO173_004304 [Letharia columbiana]|uniref:Uncharacterized protein n=1 Tax=Letharia columbiana TaxID=112416 RepID=A0A8H6FZ11_9LECA|nr:uncharacterized protein HO173_004304 [Letharia columbiana]KAF6237414.1 hypothetical protein HO173_004304 [Letharia columbiana]
MAPNTRGRSRLEDPAEGHSGAGLQQAGEQDRSSAGQTASPTGGLSHPKGKEEEGRRPPTRFGQFANSRFVGGTG